MNATAALARLRRMVQATVIPQLNDDELADLLSMAAVADSTGLAPEHDDWTATYSAIALNASAAEGWRWKAGKLSEGETFSADGASFQPEVRRQFCMDMAERYQRRVRGTITVTGRVAQSPLIALYDEVLAN